MKKFKRIVYVLFFCLLLFAIFQVSSSNVDSLRRFTPPLMEGERTKSDFGGSLIIAGIQTIVLIMFEIILFYLFRINKQNKLKPFLLFYVFLQIGISTLFFFSKVYIGSLMAVFVGFTSPFIVFFVKAGIYSKIFNGDIWDRWMFALISSIICAVPNFLFGAADYDTVIDIYKNMLIIVKIFV